MGRKFRFEDDDAEARTQRAIQRECARWHGRFADDPGASTMLRSTPELGLTPHRRLYGELLAGADAPARVGPAGAKGQGAFATTPLKAGTRVAEYHGTVVVFSRRASFEAYRSDYALQYHPYDTTVLALVDGRSAEGVARFLNHDRSPNCGWWWICDADGWHPVIVTLRAIGDGEELTLDYGEGFFDRRGLVPAQEPSA